MKWAILAAGLLVLAALAVAAVGAMLPVKHRASRRARFRQTPQAIYAVVAGPPDWRPEVKATGPLPDANGRRRWWEQDSHGEKITYELVESSSPARFVTRIADEKLPFGGTWTIEIEPVSAGESEVRVTEDGEVYNMIFRFVSRFILGYYGSIESYLQNLGAKFGEQAVIEATKP
jgi:hypothetical protein